MSLKKKQLPSPPKIARGNGISDFRGAHRVGGPRQASPTPDKLGVLSWLGPLWNRGRETGKSKIKLCSLTLFADGANVKPFSPFHLAKCTSGSSLRLAFASRDTDGWMRCDYIVHTFCSAARALKAPSYFRRLSQTEKQIIPTVLIW